jgi:hypothetical protein
MPRGYPKNGKRKSPVKKAKAQDELARLPDRNFTDTAIVQQPSNTSKPLRVRQLAAKNVRDALKHLADCIADASKSDVKVSLTTRWFTTQEAGDLAVIDVKALKVEMQTTVDI